MNNIDSRIVIGGMTPGTGSKSKTESSPEKMSVKDNVSGISARNPRPFVETELSFSTYGARDERIAVVVKNKHTGEVIREIPSEEMQKLHVHLDMLI
jgi:uncharacterized FlaG/YvyC family protein